MDALALLCNLHADGPETLHRLKESGCDRLELLAALDHDELSSVLAASASATARFLDEARSLSLRLTGRPLEDGAPVLPEYELEDEAVATSRFAVGRDEAEGILREPPSPTPMVSRSAPEDFDEFDGEDASGVTYPASAEFTAAVPDEEDDAASTRSVGEPLAEVVLQAWRELDAEESLPENGILVPKPPAPDETSERLGFQGAAQVSGGGEPATEKGDGFPTPLAAAHVDGLTDELCAALVDAGYTTLEEIDTSPTLEVAQRSGLPFTRVARLAFLIRRSLALSVDAPGRPRSATTAGWRGATTAPHANAVSGGEAAVDVGCAGAVREPAGGPFS